MSGYTMEPITDKKGFKEPSGLSKTSKNGPHSQREDLMVFFLNHVFFVVALFDVFTFLTSPLKSTFSLIGFISYLDMNGV